MKTYTVRIAKTTTEYIDVVVQAEDEEQAHEQAEELAWDKDDGWKCYEQGMYVMNSKVDK